MGDHACLVLAHPYQASHAAGVDTYAMEPWYGTYRVQPESTPQQRRIARRVGVIVLLALVTWLVAQVLHDGIDVAMTVAPVVVLAAAFGIVREVLQHRLGPWTRVSADGVMVATGLTGGRRRVAWEDVRRLEALPGSSTAAASSSY